LWQVPDGRFHIWFLDIGQGDSVLVKTPEDHQILIDGGPKNTVMEQLPQVMPFFDRSIDMVVVSHPHADHIDGLVEVLKRYKVGAVLFADK
jgi:competence protein ComEC